MTFFKASITAFRAIIVSSTLTRILDKSGPHCPNYTTQAAV
jgi:hypothetical protein